MVGQWIPGKIPGEFNWRGMDYDPMEKYRSIGEEVVFYWSNVLIKLVIIFVRFAPFLPEIKTKDIYFLNKNG